MGAAIRYSGVSSLLLGTCVPAWRLMERCYGRTAAGRFALGMAGTLAAQQALVGFAISRRKPPHRLGVVDLMTLSRGGAAALLGGLAASGVRDRRGAAGWTGWLAVLYGAILCDWLDGPIARHLGTSELGALLDLELDSWLTLCTAASAVAWGELPAFAALPPVLRYLMLFERLQTTAYADMQGDEPGWVRRMGIVQMLLFIAALAPFGGRATRLAVGITAPVQTPLQLWGLWRQRGRERG